jgi:hypothetical protein
MSTLTVPSVDADLPVHECKFFFSLSLSLQQPIDFDLREAQDADSSWRGQFQDS